MMRFYNKLKAIWDKDRKFSLLICAIGLYTLLIIELFVREIPTQKYIIWVFALIIGIGGLIIDNHNCDGEI